MEGLREYIMSVTAASMICGIILSLVGEKGTASGLVRLVCGIFIAFTVMKPIARVQLQEFSFLTDEIAREAAEAVSEGSNYAREAAEGIIKSRTEAYILDKAQALDAHIAVEVFLSDGDEPVPESVRITGNLSSSLKEQLQSMIQEDLGIPKENLIWTES